MATEFSSQNRSEYASRLRSEPLDVLVIGGGVTGAGILLDAHARGMKVGLVEMQDFAAGTSSRSTKLVHGGLRYLKQFEVELVAEVGTERAIVYENAPHVTTPVWMILPIVSRGSYGMFMSAIGLYVYDRLAKVKDRERRTMLSAEEVLALEPLLRPDHLRGAGKYVEYRTDDARLTLEIIKEAIDRGATAVNYSKVDTLRYDRGVVVGAQITDAITGETYDVFARKVINATGPWVDELRTQDKSMDGKSLHLTKGVHIVIDQSRFPLHHPVYYDVPDGRMVFAIPREGKVYVGTTDTDYHADPVAPRTTKKDRDYLVNCVNHMFPSVHLSYTDVESFWAGVRPLIHEAGKAPSEISRRDEVFVSKSGLITIAGGKLTGYRQMADKVVSLVASQLSHKLGVSYAGCSTEHIELSGGKFGGSENMPVHMKDRVEQGITMNLSRENASKLVRRYGTNIDVIYDMIDKQGKQVLESGLPLDVYVSLVYGLKHEMVVTPSDFFIRRTGAMFFHVDWVRQWAEPVLEFMRQFYGWTDEQTDSHRTDLRRQIAAATEVVDE